MDHKHFQSTKRPFSVIIKSKPTNQVIRYKHEGQVSAKIMLEQKADFYCKVSSKLCNIVMSGENSHDSGIIV